MTVDGALYRIVGALDALAEATASLPSPMPPQDSVTLLNRVRGLGRASLHVLNEEQATLLQQLLHPDFFDLDKEGLPAAARSSLALLRGYLHGCITELDVEAQRQANARAYAEAKVKEERGVGFRPVSG